MGSFRDRDWRYRDGDDRGFWHDHDAAVARAASAARTEARRLWEASPEGLAEAARREEERRHAHLAEVARKAESNAMIAADRNKRQATLGDLPIVTLGRWSAATPEGDYAARPSIPLAVGDSIRLSPTDEWAYTVVATATPGVLAIRATPQPTPDILVFDRPE